MRIIGKTLLFFALGIPVIGAKSQITPTPFAAFIGTGSPLTWSPWTSAGAFGALSITPPAIGLYCQASAGAPWTPCTPGGGGGSGTVTSFIYGTNATIAQLFTCTVATATTTPTLNCTIANAAQNSVLAGPPTGGAGPYSFQTAPTFAVTNLTGTGAFNTSGQSGTAVALASTPTQCSANQVATGIAASGNANCIATKPRSIAFSGAVSGTGVLGPMYISVPYACTIIGWSIQVDAGTDTIDFLKVASGTAIPTIGSNSINTSGVSISTGTVIQSTTLTDFTTTAVAANDIIGVYVSATSGTASLTGQLSCQ